MIYFPPEVSAAWWDGWGLYESLADTNFLEIHRDDFIRDELMIVLSDCQLSEKLQLTRDLKLETAIEMAREHELIKNQAKAQHSAASVKQSYTKQPRGKPRGPSGQHDRGKSTNNNRISLEFAVDVVLRVHDLIINNRCQARDS